MQILVATVLALCSLFLPEVQAGMFNNAQLWVYQHMASLNTACKFEIINLDFNDGDLMTYSVVSSEPLMGAYTAPDETVHQPGTCVSFDIYWTAIVRVSTK